MYTLLNHDLRNIIGCYTGTRGGEMSACHRALNEFVRGRPDFKNDTRRQIGVVQNGGIVFVPKNISTVTLWLAQPTPTAGFRITAAGRVRRHPKDRLLAQKLAVHRMRRSVRPERVPVYALFAVEYSFRASEMIDVFIFIKKHRNIFTMLFELSRRNKRNLVLQ